MFFFSSLNFFLCSGSLFSAQIPTGPTPLSCKAAALKGLLLEGEIFLLSVAFFFFFIFIFVVTTRAPLPLEANTKTWRSKLPLKMTGKETRASRRRGGNGVLRASVLHPAWRPCKLRLQDVFFSPFLSSFFFLRWLCFESNLLHFVSPLVFTETGDFGKVRLGLWLLRVYSFVFLEE